LQPQASDKACIILKILALSLSFPLSIEGEGSTEQVCLLVVDNYHSDRITAVSVQIPNEFSLVLFRIPE